MVSKAHPTLSRGLVLVLATAVGLVAANLYYAQPLVAMISHALGLSPEAAGLVVTLTQIGYGIGVFLIVPLGDVTESRRLILTMLGVTILGLLGLAFSTKLIPYFVAAFATGVGTSTVQIIVPYAANFVPPARRGQAVGTIVSGLMIGIMMSRPISSLLTDLFTWHAVFVMSAILMAVLAIVLFKVLPTRQPSSKLSYGKLVSSMVQLFLTTPILRRRAIYQAFCFGAFCLFWTASPLLLAGPDFHLSQSMIALFALVGVSGAISAPFAGKAADRGWIKPATLIALVASALSFLLSHFFSAGSFGAMGALVVSAIMLDAGITANLVLGQRAIFSLAPEFHSRLNALYIAIIFIGGACGSALGAWSFARGGWPLTSWVGFAMPALALLYFLTDARKIPQTAPS